MAQTIEERVRAVRILLSSYNDYLPDPLTGSAIIRRGLPSGPGPGKRVPCGYCRRSGRIRVDRGSRVCPVCDGFGWRPRRGARLPASHPDYEPPWDEYVEQPIEEAAQHPAAMSGHLRDRLLEQLEREARLREGDDSSERFGWERERAVYEYRGSYAELRNALTRMRIRWPPGYEQILRCYLRGLQFQLTFDDQLFLDAAEEWLARATKGQIRVPPWLQEQQAKQKQRSVAELAADGLSAGQIARLLRLPKKKVQRMLSPSEAPASVSADRQVRAIPGGPERVRA